ncbi:MAG: hypothetical protein ACP5PV_08295 [Methanothrix sp.]
MKSKPVMSWKANYTLLNDKKEIPYCFDMADPTEDEIISWPKYTGNQEDTRRELVHFKADIMMKKICDFIAFKTKYIVNYNLEGISLLEDGKEIEKIPRRIVLYCDSGEYKIGIPMSIDDCLDLAAKLTASENLFNLYNVYINSERTNDIFQKYTLLYLIASVEANKDDELRTIRNMLFHIELTKKSDFFTADNLFGKGVRSIDRNNPYHRRVIQNCLPKLRGLAESIIKDMEKENGI